MYLLGHGPTLRRRLLPPPYQSTMHNRACALGFRCRSCCGCRGEQRTHVVLNNRHPRFQRSQFLDGSTVADPQHGSGDAGDYSRATQCNVNNLYLIHSVLLFSRRNSLAIKYNVWNRLVSLLPSLFIIIIYI
jgi:hypothetical protein